MHRESDPRSQEFKPQTEANVWSSAAPHPSPESIFCEETDGKDLPIISHHFAYYWDNRPEKWIAIGLWFSSKFSCDPVYLTDLLTWGRDVPNVGSSDFAPRNCGDWRKTWPKKCHGHSHKCNAHIIIVIKWSILCMEVLLTYDKWPLI